MTYETYAITRSVQFQGSQNQKLLNISRTDSMSSVVLDDKSFLGKIYSSVAFSICVHFTYNDSEVSYLFRVCRGVSVLNNQLEWADRPHNFRE